MTNIIFVFTFAQKTEKEGGENPLFNFQDFPREEEKCITPVRREKDIKFTITT